MEARELGAHSRHEEPVHILLEAEPPRLNDDVRSGHTQLETGKTGLALSVPETDCDRMPRICIDISQQSGREVDWAISLFAEPPL